MTQNSKQRGFTLVELMLAMVFLSSILMLSTLLLIQIMNIYTKGMTVSQINQVGRIFVEEVTRKANAGGRLEAGTNCISINGVSYVWNITTNNTAAGSNGYATANMYRYDDVVTGEPINFVKVSGGWLCGSSAFIPRDTSTKMLSDRVRVYSVDYVPLSSELMRFRMVLGTYLGSGNDSNVQVSGTDFTCKPGGQGQFCAIGTMDTVLYLPQGLR